VIEANAPAARKRMAATAIFRSLMNRFLINRFSPWSRNRLFVRTAFYGNFNSFADPTVDFPRLSCAVVNDFADGALTDATRQRS
jgi:hypothetical protein